MTVLHRLNNHPILRMSLRVDASFLVIADYLVDILAQNYATSLKNMRMILLATSSFSVLRNVKESILVNIHASISASNAKMVNRSVQKKLQFYSNLANILDNSLAILETVPNAKILAIRCFLAVIYAD